VAMTNDEFFGALSFADDVRDFLAMGDSDREKLLEAIKTLNTDGCTWAQMNASVKIINKLVMAPRMKKRLAALRRSKRGK